MSSYETSKSSGCLKTALILFTIFILIAITAYFAVWRVYYNEEDLAKIDRQLDERIAVYRSIPEDRNGWEQYKEAMDKLNLTDPDDSSVSLDHPLFSYVFSGIPKDKIGMVDRVARNNAEAFKLCDEGFKKNYVFTDEMFHTPGKLPGSIKNLSSLCLMLTLRGDRQKDRKEALKCYMESIHLSSNTFENMMGTPDHSSPFNLKRIRLLLMEKDLNFWFYKSTIPQLNRLALQRSGLSDKMKMYYKRMELFQKYGNQSIKRQAGALTPIVLIYMEREMRIINKMFLNLVTAFEKNDMEGFEKLRNMKFPPLSTVGNYLAPSVTSEYRVLAMEESLSNGVVILAALQMFKAKKKEYPVSLTELVPQYLERLPYDSFAPDKKFTYKRKGKDKFILYSLGTNGKDDNGTKYDIDNGTGDFVIYDSDNKPDLGLQKDKAKPLWMERTVNSEQ